MILPRFHYHRPRTLEEALKIAVDCGGDFDYLAGGTDILPNYKNRLNNRGNLISLTGIRELHQTGRDRIGALVTLREIERSREIGDRFQVLPETCRLIATPLLREAGTVGGNVLLDTRCWFFNQSFLWRQSKNFCLKAEGSQCLVVPQQETCYATYSGDLAPVLMVLGASFHLVGPEGEREVPARRFFTHDGITRNVKLPEEILTHITLPPESRTLRAGYKKLRARDSMDYPVMGTAVALRLEGKTIAALRIAVTGTNTTPLDFTEVTEPYIGEPLTPELIGVLSEEVMNRVTPYRNVHFTPQYRKAMVGVFARRLLEELAEG